MIDVVPSLPPCPQVDVIDDAYVVAVGHLREDQNLGPSGLVRSILDCAREMLEVVKCMTYPPTLGKESKEIIMWPCL